MHSVDTPRGRPASVLEGPSGCATSLCFIRCRASKTDDTRHERIRCHRLRCRRSKKSLNNWQSLFPSPRHRPPRRCSRISLRDRSRPALQPSVASPWTSCALASSVKANPRYEIASFFSHLATIELRSTHRTCKRSNSSTLAKVSVDSIVA